MKKELTDHLQVEKKAVASKRKRELQLFQNGLGVRFKNSTLLDLALTHRSYLNESTYAKSNNERLEFLGDSVLGMVVCEILYDRFSQQKEGYLAKVKSYVVSEEVLATIALRLKVDRYLRIGKGEECSGGRQKKAILADAMEAVMGALFLDSGFKTARKLIRHLMIPEIQKVEENRHNKDYKTLLQEFLQKTTKTYPKYKLVKNEGPDHDRIFWVKVVANDMEFGPCQGKTKKIAEQQAAELAYLHFNPQ